MSQPSGIGSRLGPEALRLARDELIGLVLRIEESTDPTLVGLEGLVVGETRNTFRVERPDGRTLVVAKTPCVFAFPGPHGPIRLPGNRIRYRPEDRIKKVR